MERDQIKTGRRLFTLSCLLGAVGVGLPFSADAAQIASVTFDDTLTVNNQLLKLNGAGVRYKVVFQVYAAGLYLAEKQTTEKGALAVEGVRRIRLVMLRELTNEQLGQSFMTGMKKNSSVAERAKMVAQMTDFGEMFASIPLLKKGDVLDTDWIPGTGTFCYLNGKKITGPLPDVAFFNAILKIWIGHSPANEQLKLNLLGEKFAL